MNIYNMSTDINTQTIEYTAFLWNTSPKQNKLRRPPQKNGTLFFPSNFCPKKIQVFHSSVSSRSTSCVRTRWRLDFLHGIHFRSWSSESWKLGNHWTSLWTFCTFQARLGWGWGAEGWWLVGWLTWKIWHQKNDNIFHLENFPGVLEKFDG